MFHWFGVVQNTRGDALPGWQVALVDLSGGSVEIFSDENGSAIQTVSGVANRAVADENGNYDFFVPNGTYTLQFYNASGVFQRSKRFVAMYGNPATVPVKAISGAAYTLVFNDGASVLRFSNATSVTLTIPNDSLVNHPIGTPIEVHQVGAGQVIPTAGAGVTLNVRSGVTRTAVQHSVISVRKVAANTWILSGDLA